MKQLFKLSWAMIAIALMVQFSSCKEDPQPPAVIASFTFAVDANDFMTVNFTNASQEYATLAWEFGDGNASAEVSPSHTYTALGTYTVKLTATNGDVTDSHSETITIADPNAFLTKLVGETSKTWKLLRDVTTGVYPLEVGPYDHSTIWWAVGLNNDELAGRPCMLNDEWTFGRDLSMAFDDKGDYWAEGSVYPDGANNKCASSAEPMLNKAGADVSAWSSGTHTFELTQTTLKVIGNGAYLGLSKVGTDLEYTEPQQSVTYNVLSLYDGDVDTLVVEVNYYFAAGDPAFGGYWRFVLVHYDDPNAEPPIPTNNPKPAFDMAVAGNTVTFTNTSQYCDSYSWDFGDGTTETTADVVHTFTNDGFYNVVLTGINPNGEVSVTKPLFLNANTPALTDAALQGAAWKVVVGEKTVFVGPAMGASDWWSVPKAFLDGTGPGGGDDWTCMADDEFTFSATGYSYATNGSARNDGYFGAPNGCIDDAGIAASGNGAALGSASFNYVFTPAAGDSRAIIELMTLAGDTHAGFIGFYKGYYGGENGDGANAANGGLNTNRYEVMGYAAGGGKEFLFVTVDISAGHDGSASWSSILYR